MKAALATLALLATPALAADANNPTVIELYQSQGCSSCPPANAILNGLGDRADLLPLMFSVTYWDRLGWPDTFAHPLYTERQWDFSRAGGRGQVATPQFIVNGRGVVTGSNAQALAAEIRKQDRGARGPAITAASGRVTVGAGKPAKPALVWLVRYDPRTQNVRIGNGENGGRVLPHRNVVTAMSLMGTWDGKPLAFSEPAYKDARQRSAVLVQNGRGGAILAARRL